jgi:hypothetical protein
MRKLLPLLFVTLLLAGCPKAETSARDSIAGQKAFIDSIAAKHAECNDPDTRKSAQVCVLVDKANAIKHVAGDALNEYCSSPSYDLNGGACTPPTDKTQGDQLKNKLQAALRDLDQIISDIKALNP